MKNEKRKFSAEFKVKVVREHLENQVPVGKICEQYNIQPNLFYLWKKESAPGKQAATQYMLSTLVKNGVVVLSLMVMKPSVTEDDVFLQIQKYTSHFDTISSEQCEKVLAMPIAH